MEKLSSTPEFVDVRAQKPARLPEKSSFSQTCSLLSQYLKDKGSFGDLGFGITACNIEGNGNGNGDGLPEIFRPTMNLFPMTEKPGDVCARNMENPRNIRSMDLFPQAAGFAATSVSKEDVQKRLEPCVKKPAEAEPQTAQLTIFYAGQVMVFDDFPADKAKEVMLLASKGSSQNHNTFPSIVTKSHSGSAPDAAKVPIESISIPRSSITLPNFGNNLTQERMQPSPKPIANDLPIARRASLHRFLEKRKDRINSKSPYQAGGPLAAPSKQVESKSWLGLAAQSPQ